MPIFLLVVKLLLPKTVASRFSLSKSRRVFSVLVAPDFPGGMQEGRQRRRDAAAVERRAGWLERRVRGECSDGNRREHSYTTVPLQICWSTYRLLEDNATAFSEHVTT
ncbi:hypothetical protein PUN28_005784 [Cardiocondyla obscurior]|uniref:Secreted protein n=1 Tax=Cardiocondyla obscurior TaxID=286306 RepID=A0AAW2GAI7_9HYME